MHDVFISYCQSDRDRVASLAESLLASGWSVWWDPLLRAGESFDAAIENKLRSCEVVLVCWSRSAIRSEYVLDEARFALKLGKLLPVRLNSVEVPFRYQGLHTISLADWDGKPTHQAFKELNTQIKGRMNLAARVANDPTLSATQKTYLLLAIVVKGVEQEVQTQQDRLESCQDPRLRAEITTWIDERVKGLRLLSDCLSKLAAKL
jgi:TIR domain